MTLKNWIATEKQPPTDADADKHGDVITIKQYINGQAGINVVNYLEVISYPNVYPFWLPVPAFPEGGEA